MSEFGEALGTAVEGGLFAKAVGRGSKALPDTAQLEQGHFAEGTCLNCGTQLMGAHCHACGQKAHLHRTLGAFMHDLLHGALHFEGKTWKTLPMLAFRPGQLTRRYIEGERARFVSPMALFLFSIFLMFAVFQAVGLTAPTDISSAEGVQTGLKTMLEDAEAERNQLTKTLATMDEGSPEYAETEKLLADQGDQLTDDETSDVTEKLEALKKALDGEDIDAIRSATEALLTSSQEFGQRLYDAAAQQAGDAGMGDAGFGGDDDVVDAEIVDEQ